MKIKQVKMRLEMDPTHLYKETIVEVCYDPTDKSTTTYKRSIPEYRFYVKLPQVMADSLGYTTSRGNNQEEAMKSFEADLVKFRNLKVESNRVILYYINVNPDVKRANTTVGYRVDIWAGTYIETIRTDGAGIKRYSYEAAESSVDYSNEQKHSYNYTYAHRSFLTGEGTRHDNQVPWTEQNEAFFLWVQSRMAELVARLADLSTPDKMLEVISMGGLLPLLADRVATATEAPTSTNQGKMI